MKTERARDNCCGKSVRYREKPMGKTNRRLDRRKQGCRSKCPSTPLLPFVCLFFEYPVFVLHHPVHDLLSRSSPFLSIRPSISYLCRESPLIMSVLLPCSNYVYQRSFLYRIFRYFFHLFLCSVQLIPSILLHVSRSSPLPSLQVFPLKVKTEHTAHSHVQCCPLLSGNPQT